MRYQFTLIISGVSELTSRLADVLYEATGGDIEVGMVDGVLAIEFERNADSLRHAVLAAIRQVEALGLGLHVERVESETATTIAQINTELTEAER